MIGTRSTIECCCDLLPNEMDSRTRRTALIIQLNPCGSPDDWCLMLRHPARPNLRLATARSRSDIPRLDVASSVVQHLQRIFCDAVEVTFYEAETSREYSNYHHQGGKCLEDEESAALDSFKHPMIRWIHGIRPWPGISEHVRAIHCRRAKRQIKLRSWAKPCVGDPLLAPDHAPRRTFSVVGDLHCHIAWNKCNNS